MYVYFIRADRLNLIKIGRAENVGRRLAGMRSNSADRLTLLGVIKEVRTEALEARLHRRFVKYRSHGEWFRPEPALLRYIKANAGPIEPPTSAEDCERRMIRAFPLSEMHPAARRSMAR